MININLNILNSLICFSFLVLYRELCSVILGILCYCLLLIVHCILSLEFHSQVIWNKAICTACANHNPVVSSFMTHHQILNKCNTTGATKKEETVRPSEHLISSLLFFFLFYSDSLCSVLSTSACVVFVWPLCFCICLYYYFSIPLWYLQTFLILVHTITHLLNTPLVSSNLFYTCTYNHTWSRILFHKQWFLSKYLKH